jgi:iron complex transport system permease protein
VSPMARVHRRAAWLAVVLLGLSVLLMGIGAGVGSTGWSSIRNLAGDPAAWQIVLDIRLPRTLGAWLAGALLGLAGAVAQGLFRNPLADPFLLGSASGASLGVALALALFGASPLAASWLTTLGLTGAAFVGAMAAVLLTLALARGVQHTLRLLLAGVIVGVVLGALGSLVTLMVPETMPAMQAFLLGSTGFVGWPACVPMGIAFVLCLTTAWTVSPVLDGLTLGEATARQPGPAAGALATLALVAVTGPGHRGRGGADRPDRLCRPGRAAPGALGGPRPPMPGWWGCRRWPDGRCTAAGGRSCWRAAVIAPQELPVGVLTAVLGGGYLLWLMHRRVAAPRGRCERYGFGRRWACPCGAGLASEIPRFCTVLDLSLPAGTLDLHRRAQRRRQIHVAQGAGRAHCPTPAQVTSARLADGRPCRAGMRARQLAWLGPERRLGAEDLSAWDVAMLGRLPHQPWLVGAQRGRPRRGGASAARHAGLGTGASARAGPALRRRAPARAAGPRAGRAGTGAAHGRTPGQPRPAAPGRLVAHGAASRSLRGVTVVSVLHEISHGVACRFELVDPVCKASCSLARVPAHEAATHVAAGGRCSKDRIAIHPLAGTSGWRCRSL